MMIIRRASCEITAACARWLLLFFVATPALGMATLQGDPISNPEVIDDTTIVYGVEFFKLHPNAVTVLDVIRRIPAGQQILDAARGSDRRGFSAIDDKILINGKRLSGKINDSESALSRITMDQVERIEIIRGSSPDIKVASGEGVINIVLKRGAGSGGTGSYRLDLQSVRLFKDFSAAAEVSYGASAGKFGYNLSASGYFVAWNFDQHEQRFSGAGELQQLLDERVRRDIHGIEFTGNFNFDLSADTTMRMNAFFSPEDGDVTKNGGVLSLSDAQGAIIEVGETRRRADQAEPSYEFGGDVSSKLGDKFNLKILALANRKTNDIFQGEDFLIENDVIEDDIQFVLNSTETERVGRVSVDWRRSESHQFEIGTEFAANRLASNLELFERQADVLVETPVENANTKVKEIRNESFLVHSWKINSSLTLDSQLFSEWSRITQTGQNSARNRQFFFLRPSFDFKWNLTESQQIQLIARREISQLDFLDFASTASDDDQIIGGNTELEPEQTWRFRANFEKRFAEDSGRIKIGFAHRRTANKIELIEISPGVSGRGNIGQGVSYTGTLDGSFRMNILGLPNLLLEPSAIAGIFRVTDPFTGERRRFNEYTAYRFTLRARHDLRDLGISYGGEYEREGPTRFNDIDEFIDFPSFRDLELFVEKSLFGTAVLRVEGSNLLNIDEGRDRFFFADGIADRVLTSREIRRRHEGRRFDIILRGTF